MEHEMEKRFEIKTGLGMLLLFFSVTTLQVRADVQRDVQKDVDKMEHALGWDAVNLKVIEADKMGLPTLERDSNEINRIERTTSYHSNGKKESQTLTVVAKANNKTLYHERKEWSKSGRLTEDNVEDDAFNGDGKQMAGLIDEQTDRDGRLTMEVKKRYSVATNDWGLVYKQSLSYYGNMDMKERITEDPTSDSKTQETWGPKYGDEDRKETTKKWDSTSGTWQ
jgi:hypothetical protein